MNEGQRPSPALRLGWIVLPLILGVLAASLIPRPVVGLIYLNDAIHAFSARDMIDQIRFAHREPEVRAVVLVLDSPGGTVSDTEAVYLELARLRSAKPVVTMVQGMAASGAYYLSVGTELIIAGPSSQIGNVGVISELPPYPLVLEDLISTGPYKIFGAPRDTQLRRMETIKQGFYRAVLKGRGDKLEIEAETLLRGEIWPGSEARRLGLVDELGSLSLAVEQAARLAHVANYQVEDLRELADLPPAINAPFFVETEQGVITPYPRRPGYYLLYIPPPERRSP